MLQLTQSGSAELHCEHQHSAMGSLPENTSAKNSVHNEYVETRVVVMINLVTHYLAQLSEDWRHNFVQLGNLKQDVTFKIVEPQERKINQVKGS